MRFSFFGKTFNFLNCILMNVPSHKELQKAFDQIQQDHPIGGIALRNVEESLKKHPPPKTHKKKHGTSTKSKKNDKGDHNSDKSERSENTN